MTGSPAWVEEKILKFYEFAVARTAAAFAPPVRRGIFLLLFAAASLILLFSAEDSLIDPDHEQSLFVGFYFYRQCYQLIFATLIAGCAMNYMPRAWWNPYRIFFTVAAILALVISMDSRWLPAEALLLNAVLPFAIFFGFYGIARGWASRWAALVPYLATVACFALFYLIPARTGYRMSWIVDLGRLLVIFVILSLEDRAGRYRLPVPAVIGAVFQPFNLLVPLPLEKRHRENVDDFPLRIRGLFDVFIGLGLMAAALPLRHVSTGQGLYAFTERWSVGAGFVSYVYRFMVSYGWISIPVGLGRWLGFNLYDAFHLPLLAVSPHERWRRWNVYYYNWFYKTVFFPVLRFSRSPFLAVMAVFGLTLVMHLHTYNYVWMFGDSAVLPDYWIYRARVPFFLLHGLVIYVSLKTARFWPSASSWRGWIGVAIVTLLMSLVHLIPT